MEINELKSRLKQFNNFVILIIFQCLVKEFIKHFIRNNFIIRHT